MENKGIDNYFQDIPTPEEIQKQLEEEKQKKEEKSLSKNDKIKEKKQGRPRVNKEHSYKITLIIDEILEDYMKESPFITMETRKDYLNRLIKEDFVKLIGGKMTDDDETLQKKWNEYKEERRQCLRNLKK